MELQKVFSFIAFTQKFRAVNRDVHVGHAERFESDMEHSYQLAMFAWYLNNEKKLGYNTDLLLRYALVHDLVETYAGDTPGLTSSDEFIASKLDREKAALDKISEDFSEFPEMLQYILDYENKKDKESRFVYGVDKVMPILNELQQDSGFYKTNNITAEKWMGWLDGKLEKIDYTELEDGGFMDLMKQYLVVEKERMFAK